MTAFIILFGTLTLLAGLIIIHTPERVFGPIRNNIENPWLHVAAVLVRTVLGLLLLRQADLSRWPVVIEFIGWLSLAAACIFALIGPLRFRKLMRWALSFTQPLGRLGGILAAGFGAFLVWAFV